MNSIIILLTALLPIAILVFYICHKDKNNPEPTKIIVKTFFMGVASVFVSILISTPLGLAGAYPDEVANIWDGIRTSFFGAAIPEEIAKFLMLWLVLRKNNYFDEKMDGIVYAVVISLGFAAFENILYLFSNVDSFLSVAIMRALFAVPGHFCFGILMGYYYSLAVFYPKATSRNKVLVLIAPIIAHGVYDSLIFTMNVAPSLAFILLITFLVFCHKLWKLGCRHIKEHLQRDNITD